MGIAILIGTFKDTLWVANKFIFPWANKPEAKNIFLGCSTPSPSKQYN